MKLNFDGSIRNEVATTRFVIRNWDGHVMLASVKKIGQTSIIVAECLALRDGLAYTIHKSTSTPKGKCKAKARQDGSSPLEYQASDPGHPPTLFSL
ncbi:unnamed protein product [Prunus brigantina]